MPHEYIDLNGKYIGFSHFHIEVLYSGLITVIEQNKHSDLEDAVEKWKHGIRDLTANLVDGDYLSLSPYFAGESGEQRLLTLISEAIDLMDKIEDDPMPVDTLNKLYGTEINTETGTMPKQVIRDAFNFVNHFVKHKG